MLTRTIEFEQAVVLDKDLGYRESDEKIYVTKNYSIFKIPPQQRPITKKAIEDLLKIIQENNDLANHPIIVNEQMEVIGGQTRLACAKILQVEIFFKIKKDARIIDSLIDGKSTRPWDYADVLHYWCAVKAPEYLFLQDFWEKNDFFTLKGCAEMCTTTGGQSAERKESFQMGHYKMDNRAFGDKVARMILDFKPYCFFYREKPFVSTVRSLANNPAYDHRRMMKKMAYQEGKLTKQATSEAYFSQINVIYNNRMLKKDHVFLAPGSRRKNSR